MNAGNDEFGWLRTDLRRSVRNLAATPEVQEQYLREIGTWPSLDELALDFEDGFETLREKSIFTKEQLRGLTLLDELLLNISGTENASFWEPGALTCPEWCEIRHAAAVAMLLL